MHIDHSRTPHAKARTLSRRAQRKAKIAAGLVALIMSAAVQMEAR